MPTGYTAPIHDNEPITFEQFALRCSRAMGAAIMQRDETLDVEIQLRTVGDYEQKNVDKARAELDEALARTDDEWATLQDAQIRDETAYRAEYMAKTSALAVRYDDMLREVLAWVPPTDEHIGLKKFMIDQLNESIRFDVGQPSGRWLPPISERLSVVEYKAAKIALASKRLADATQRLHEEHERVRSQNAWVVALRDSLKATASA